MPAPKFLAGLPKPLLFALYGAVGGLLGALVFAEPLFHILKPPAAPKGGPPEPQVAVAASKDVEVFVDGRNTLPVQIARADFDGPVTVRMDGLPAGVSAAPVVIPAGADKGEVVLVGGSTARVVAAHGAKAVAEATHDGKKATAEAPVAIKVTDPPKPLADIVIVLDTSVSMQWALDELKDGIGQLTQSLGKARVDYRLALVTFRDRNDGGEKVTVVQFKGGPFTADAGVFREEVGQIKVLIGTGVDSPQPCLEGIARASELDFRKGATKMMLVVTDNPPKVGPGNDVTAAVQNSANQVKGANLDAVHLVTWAGDKDRWYAPLLNGGLQPGRHFNIKEVVTGDQGFAALLDTLGGVVTAAARAKSPDSTPKVAERVEGPKLGVRSLQSGQQTAAGTEGRVVLQSSVWTGAIAALVCLFLVGGQSHYLRGKLPAVGGTLAGLLGGLTVGVVGGAAGQGLFFLAPESDTLAKIFRVFGWALLGGMAGTGLSLFVPNMKWTLGLAGGALGGAVGCVGFIAVSAATGDLVGRAGGALGGAVGCVGFIAVSAATGDLVGRLVGGLVLGFCIGLMVAVAEAAFRRAWLEVKYGERERITVTLGPEPVKVGSDARACTVWARGAPPIALRFFVRDGAVICSDTATGREAPVGDGFAKEVGTLTVTVRTGSGTPAPVAPPPLPKPKAAPPKPKPLDLDDDDGFDLPMPVSPPAKPQATPAPPKPTAPPVPPKPVAAPTPPKPPPAPPKPVAAPAPPKPPAPAPPKPVVIPPVAPAIKSTAKNPDACPGCSRVIPGKPGARYCMMCDQSF